MELATTDAHRCDAEGLHSETAETVEIRVDGGEVELAVLAEGVRTRVRVSPQEAAHLSNLLGAAAGAARDA